ncbi:hypothetical protein AOLI_G00217180 [Acnodon oligacanthus]
MTALHNKFGRPHQLALQKIAAVLEAPEIKHGDIGAFQSKLPAKQRAEFHQQQSKQPGATHNLYDLSEWLRYESWCQIFDSPAIGRSRKERQNPKIDSRPGRQTVTVLHGAGQPSETTLQPPKGGSMKGKAKYQLKEWIQANKRCWHGTRAHRAAQCTLKKPCNLCQGTHLLALHGLNTRTGESRIDVTAQEESCLTNSTSESFYLDRPDAVNRVLLKVVPVLIRYGGRTLDTFAILNDGSERSMLLPAAAKSLGIRGSPEALPLCTVRQDIQVLKGRTVLFHVSPVANPQTGYEIKGAFTAGHLSLAQHTYLIECLQRKFRHLRGLPIPALRDAKPSLLVGSD